MVFNEDNLAADYIKFGVKFRQIMREWGAEGKNVRGNVLAAMFYPVTGPHIQRAPARFCPPAL